MGRCIWWQEDEVSEEKSGQEEYDTREDRPEEDEEITQEVIRASAALLHQEFHRIL